MIFITALLLQNNSTSIMKTILLIITLLFSISQSFSQEYSIPKDYNFKTKDDYVKYEKHIIEGVNWLLKSPLTSEKTKRKEINAFIMKWMTGSPTVSIELSQDIVTFMDCPDCLMLFMGGWTKHVIETKDNSNKSKGNLAGILAVIEFYNLNKAALGKNKAIEKYIKIQTKGTLEKYIDSKM